MIDAIIDVAALIPALPAVALVLLGALVAVDQVSVAQLQLGHPLVAGTLAGAVCGRPLEGALLGLLLAGHRPVGGVIPPDAGPAAVAAAAVLCSVQATGPGAPRELPGAPLAAALLAGLVLADLGRHTEAWTRRRNLDFLRNAEARATPQAVTSAILLSVGLAALRGALTVALAVPLVGALERRIPPGGPGAVVVVALLGGIGLAAGERLLGTSRRQGLLLAGVAAGVALLWGGRS
jgi:mannose/fructose/N-acetylgalactosamine-specific phosphotransferase system component IIC